MGFGSYDEGEQEDQGTDGDLDLPDDVPDARTEHEGDVRFEFGATNDELLDRLEEIKER